MIRSLMIAGSVALSALMMTTGAEAKTRVGVYFGVPFYDYQAGPGWRYYDGYGWYDYGRYGEFRHDRRYNRGWLSCGAARNLVADRGYARVRVVECNGSTYTFRGIDRRGRMVMIYVSARNGSVWRG